MHLQASKSALEGSEFKRLDLNQIAFPMKASSVQAFANSRNGGSNVNLYFVVKNTQLTGDRFCMQMKLELSSTMAIGSWYLIHAIWGKS